MPDTVDRFGEEIAQRACLELADALVSPSEWLVRWLREHEWTIPRSARVIQNLWQSTALDESVVAAEPAPIRRLAFFGQVREGKGVRLFIECVRSLPADLEVLFLGHSRTGRSERLQEAIGRPVRLEPNLDRDAAIAELRQPGTLAVMPSLLENSPYAVAECIEHRHPVRRNRGRRDVGSSSLPRIAGACLLRADDGGIERRSDRALWLAPAPGTAGPPARRLVAAWLELVETIEPVGGFAGSHGQRRLDSVRRRRSAAPRRARGGSGIVGRGRRHRRRAGRRGGATLPGRSAGRSGSSRTSTAPSGSSGAPRWRAGPRGRCVPGRRLREPRSSPSRRHSRRAVRAPEQPGERLAVLNVFEHGDGRPLRQLPQLAATLAAALARPRFGAVAARRSPTAATVARLGSRHGTRAHATAAEEAAAGERRRSERRAPAAERAPHRQDRRHRAEARAEGASRGSLATSCSFAVTRSSSST